jgi:hypothetical protein
MARHVTLLWCCPCLLVRAAQVVLRKLSQLLSQPRALNLVITGIVSHLAQSPNPLVHAYLFPAAALRGEDVPWPNVVSTLKSV